MHLVRATDAVPYDPPGHHGVAARRLQGGKSGGPERLTVSISDYEPGATVDPVPVPATTYVLLAGSLELTLHDDDGTERHLTLHAHDSVHFVPGEVRSLRNATASPASLLVVRPDPGPA